MHRVYCDNRLPAPDAITTLSGDEAAHAIVRRLSPGEAIELLDGRGGLAIATVQALRPGRGKRAAELDVLVGDTRVLPPISPALHVRTATPKGERVDTLIDQLSQIGAASWGPLLSARAVVDPRATKLDRLTRIAIAAGKQCGRAHLLAIHPPTPLPALLPSTNAPRNPAEAGPAPARARLIIADASAAAYSASGSGDLTLLIGPEGGWTHDEFAAARHAGAIFASFGPHVMRIETAAAAAAATILSLERAAHPAPTRTGEPR